MDQPTTITCLNGHFMRAERAAVSVADRGFRFGDGVFETIRLSRGVPYQWGLHMARMAQGLLALDIPAPEVDWAALAKRIITRNKAKEGYLRIAVSRGTGSRGYLPHPPRMPATFVIEYLPPLPAPEAPYTLWLSEWAKIPANCLPSTHKLAQGVNSTLALQEAQSHGCNEALQLSTSGMLSETAGANLFWLQGDTLFTPSLETNCLSGTTLDAVLRLSHLPTRSINTGLATLEKADAVFISNCRLGVHPISSIQPMGWHYDTEHKAIKAIAKALTADRLRSAWDE